MGAPTATGFSLPLTNHYNLYYTAPVSMGGKSYDIDWDTGSSNAFVFASACALCRDPTLVPTTTFLDVQAQEEGGNYTRMEGTLEVDYGSGKVTGPVGTIDVSLASPEGTLTVPSVPVLAVSAGVGFATSRADGLIGLAFPALAAGNVQTWLQALGETHTLDTLSVAFYMTGDPDGEPGEIRFGGINPALFSGEIAYVPLTSDSYWEISVTSASSSLPLESGQVLQYGPASGIVDTGTSLLMGPYEFLGPFADQVGRVPTNCSLVDWEALPNMIFSLAGHDFTLTPHDYIIGVDGECELGFDVQPPGLPIAWTLGCTFLRSFYTIFDVDRNAIGLAPIIGIPP